MNFEEWIHLGNLLKESRNILMREHLKYSKSSFERKRMDQALGWIDKIDTKLDDVVCHQFPDNPLAITVFYGPVHIVICTKGE